MMMYGIYRLFYNFDDDVLYRLFDNKHDEVFI